MSRRRSCAASIAGSVDRRIVGRTLNRMKSSSTLESEVETPMTVRGSKDRSHRYLRIGQRRSGILMAVTHLFFDIGGVLGTNGWDREQRATGAAQCELDGEFESRHGEIVAEWEIGRVSLDEYLDFAVFYCPRTFS